MPRRQDAFAPEFVLHYSLTMLARHELSICALGNVVYFRISLPAKATPCIGEDGYFFG